MGDEGKQYVFTPSWVYATGKVLCSGISQIAYVLLLFQAVIGVLSEYLSLLAGVELWVRENAWMLETMGWTLLVGNALWAFWNFKRSRCVFEKEGFIVEQGGLFFQSDPESWHKITDANLERTVLEQLTGAGTLHVEIDGRRTLALRHYGNFRYLHQFFRNKANENYANSTRINTV